MVTGHLLGLMGVWHYITGEFSDRKFSASYITGKLCDVAEAYSNDETVKVSLMS